jgi:hypothetical protein
MDLESQIAHLKSRVFYLRTQMFREPSNDYLYFMSYFLKKKLKGLEESTTVT